MESISCPHNLINCSVCLNRERHWQAIETARTEGYAQGLKEGRAAERADIVAWAVSMADSLGKPCDDGCCSPMPESEETLRDFSWDIENGKHEGAAAKKEGK